MADVIKPPTRAQFVKMGADPQTVRALESLFAGVTGSGVVPDLSATIAKLADVDLVAGFAAAQALQAVNDLVQARDAIGALSLTPAGAAIEELAELRKQVEGLSNAHNAEWISEVFRLRDVVDGLAIAPPILPAVSSSVAVSAPASARGMGVSLLAVRTSADVIQFTADALVVDTAAGGSPVMLFTVNVSPNKTTAGPAANGRDQAGAFGAGTWAYLHVIYNPAGPTVAGLWSLSATAPTLPTGFTHFAMVHPARVTGSGFIGQVGANRDVIYSDGFGSSGLLLASGAATVNTAVSLAALVPPQSRLAKIGLDFNSTTVGSEARVHDVDATTGDSLRVYAQVSGVDNSIAGEVPTSAAQGIFYANTAAGGLLFLHVLGFRW